MTPAAHMTSTFTASQPLTTDPKPMPKTYSDSERTAFYRAIPDRLHPYVEMLESKHTLAAIYSLTTKHIQVMQTYGVPLDKIQAVTAEEIERFENRFYQTDHWGYPYYDKDKRVLAFNCAKTYGFKALDKLSYTHFQIMDIHKIACDAIEAIKDLTDKELIELDKYRHGSSGDRRLTAYKLAAKHGSKAIMALSCKHLEVIEQHEFPFEHIRPLTEEEINQFEKYFYEKDRWDRITRDKRVFAFALAKQYGFKRILRANLNIGDVIVMENFKLSLEQAEDEGFKKIMSGNINTATRDILLSLLSKRKDISCTLALTLSDPQIQMLAQHDLAVKQALDARFTDLYNRIERKLHAKAFQVFKDASEAVIERIHKLPAFCAYAMIQYDFSFELIEDLKFIAFVQSIAEVYRPMVLQLINENGLQKVATLTAAQIEAKHILGLSFAEIADAQFAKFSQELAASFHGWEEIKQKRLFTNYSLEEIVLLNANQLHAILGLNFTVAEVQDPNFADFYSVFENDWSSNIPAAIEEALRLYPYQRIFKLDRDRLLNLADRTAALEKLERDIGLQVYMFTEEEVNEPSFNEVCKRDLARIFQLVSGRDLVYSKRIFSLDDDQFEAFEQGLELDVVEDLGFKQFYAKLAKDNSIYPPKNSFRGLRKLACDLIKKEGPKIWKLSDLQFEARTKWELPLEIVTNPDFEALFKQYYNEKTDFVALIKISDWFVISKLMAEQFEGIFKHKLSLLQVTHQYYRQFFQNFLKSHAKLGLELIQNNPCERIFCLITSQVEGIIQFGLTLIQVEDPEFIKVYARADEARKNDFALIKLGLTYLEVAAASDSRKATVLNTGIERLSQLERNCLLAMLTYGLSIESVESEDFGRFIKNIQDEVLRSVACKLITEDKKPYPRVFALKANQLQARLTYNFTLEKLEIADHCFTVAIKEWGEQAAKIIEGNTPDKTYNLERLHFEGMIKYGLSIDDVTNTGKDAKDIKCTIEKDSFITFYNRVQDEDLRRFAFNLITGEKKLSATVFALTIIQLQAMQQHKFSLEQVEDPGFIKLYDNLLRTHVELSVQLLKKYGYQKIVNLTIEQINGIKDLGLTFEQVVDPGYSVLYKEKEGRRKLLLTWLKEGLSYEKVIEINNIPEQSGCLEVLQKLVMDNALERAAIFNLTVDQLTVIKQKNLSFTKYKEFEALKIELKPLLDDANKLHEVVACCQKILDIVPQYEEVIVFKRSAEATIQRQAKIAAIAAAKKEMQSLLDDKNKLTEKLNCCKKILQMDPKDKEILEIHKSTLAELKKIKDTTKAAEAIAKINGSTRTMRRPASASIKSKANAASLTAAANKGLGGTTATTRKAISARNAANPKLTNAAKITSAANANPSIAAKVRATNAKVMPPRPASARVDSKKIAEDKARPLLSGKPSFTAGRPRSAAASKSSIGAAITPQAKLHATKNRIINSNTTSIAPKIVASNNSSAVSKLTPPGLSKANG